jgi:hypothetical protein
MAKAGDSLAKLITLTVARGTTAGAALSYANKAALTAAGWDLIAYDVDGVALTSQPTWSIAVVDATTGAHRVKWTMPSGKGYIRLTIPTYWRADPYGWTFDGQTYDDDAIAGLLLINQGVPAISSAADGNLGDVVEHDSYKSPTLNLTLGKLARFGYAYSDLAAGFTFSAMAKHQPSDTAVAITFTAGASIATDGAFTIGWDTFPATILTLDNANNENAKTVYIDVQVKHTATGRLITTNRYALQVVWDRDTAT